MFSLSETVWRYFESFVILTTLHKLKGMQTLTITVQVVEEHFHVAVCIQIIKRMFQNILRLLVVS